MRQWPLEEVTSPRPSLAVVRGLMYSDSAQILNRWLMPAYGMAFRWTGSRVDSEEATRWVFVDVVRKIQLPDLVQVVDEEIADALLHSLERHWRGRYGLPAVARSELYVCETAPNRPTSLADLFDRLSSEMRLLLVLRFVRKRPLPAIGAQLGLRPASSRLLLVSALGQVAQRVGLHPALDGTVEVARVSGYVDDIVARRPPARFQTVPATWRAIVGATHVQAAIAGNALPEFRFVRALEQELQGSAEADS